MANSALGVVALVFGDRVDLDQRVEAVNKNYIDWIVVQSNNVVVVVVEEIDDMLAIDN